MTQPTPPAPAPVPTPPAPTPPPAPAPAPPAPTPPTPPAPEEHGFPANTPLEQMKPEQREAYWKHYARQHEDRNRALGGLTPEQLADLRAKADKHDALERDLMSDKDKAVAEAADKAKADAQAELIPDLVQARFEAAAGGRLTPEQITGILAPLDLKYFLDAAGKVDTAKVNTYVEQIAPAKGTPPKPKGPTVTGHGSASGGELSGLSGSELYDRMHPKKTA